MATLQRIQRFGGGISCHAAPYKNGFWRYLAREGRSVCRCFCTRCVLGLFFLGYLSLVSVAR